MSVNLAPQLEEDIKKRVESGLYHDANEVVSEALRLLGEKEAFQRLKATQISNGAIFTN